MSLGQVHKNGNINTYVWSMTKHKGSLDKVSIGDKLTKEISSYSLHLTGTTLGSSSSTSQQATIQTIKKSAKYLGVKGRIKLVTIGDLPIPSRVNLILNGTVLSTKETGLTSGWQDFSYFGNVSLSANTNLIVAMGTASDEYPANSEVMIDEIITI